MINVSGLPVVALGFEREDASEGAIALLENDDGVFRVDWESYVAYGEMPLAELFDKRPTTPTLFRLFAAPSDYYNFEYQDPARYVSVVLAHRDEPPTFYGFAERDSEVGRALFTLLATSTEAIAVTIRLSFPAGSEATDCVRIDELIAPNWMPVADE